MTEILHPITQALHILSVVVWVGGMFFAYVALRPVAAQLLEPPQRLSLWARTFARFFPWVWVAVVLLLVTGFAMMFLYFGGMKAPVYIHLMMGLGLVMMAIFGHVYFGPYHRLRQAVLAQDWKDGGNRLAQIRMLIGVNLLLGLSVVVIAAAGRYL